MNSPFQTSSTNWNVPNLYEALRDWRARQDKATQQIGDGLKQIGQAVVGGIQGAKNPSAFGDGTSKTAGGIMGAFMNAGGGTGSGVDGFSSGQTSVDAPTFDNANNSGFAGLINPRNGMSDGNNFARFAAAGKAADANFKEMAAATPRLEGEDPVAFGVPQSQWDHMSTADKIATRNGWMQAQAAKAQMQAYDMGQQHMQQVQLQMQQAKDKSAAEARYNQGVVDLTRPVPLAQDPMTQSGPVQSPILQNFANAAANPQPLNGAEMQRLAAVSGMNPQDGLVLAKSAYELARAQHELRQQQTGPTDWKNPATGRHYSILNNTMLPSKSDEELMTEAQAKANAVSGNAQLSSITKQLMELYKKPQQQQLKPENAKRIAELEAERESLLFGGSRGSIPTENNNDPLGLFEK